MTHRRNEFDVSNRINTTDPVCVRLEVGRIHRGLYPEAPSPVFLQAYADVSSFYCGDHPGYEKCDTAYHDLQHVLEVSLAMARLLDGYERSRGDSPALGERLFQLGVVCALFHDIGYLRRRGDHRHRRGAEYTRTHVTRGGRVLREYLPTIGMGEFVAVAKVEDGVDLKPGFEPGPVRLGHQFEGAGAVDPAVADASAGRGIAREFAEIVDTFGCVDAFCHRCQRNRQRVEVRNPGTPETPIRDFPHSRG